MAVLTPRVIPSQRTPLPPPASAGEARRGAAWSFLVLIGLAAAARGAEPTIVPVLLSPIEAAEVPAREAGVLERLVVAEGTLVEPGDVLAELDAETARLQVERTAALVAAAEVEAQDETAIRLAEKGRELAEADLVRAVEARKRYANAVADAELQRLETLRDRAALEVESARRDAALAARRLATAEAEHRLAEAVCTRRTIRAPIAGVVVEVRRRQGEWVEPGETVFRVLRVERLRAEGVVPPEWADVAVGAPVRLVPTEGEAAEGAAGATGGPEGRLEFVSPEASRVDGRVRFHAVIDNADLRLRPGMQARLVWPAADDADPGTAP